MIQWISDGVVLSIHDDVISMYGGLPGVRSTGGLSSALSSPQNHYVNGMEDVFDLAAQYALSLTRAHAFSDGNKRTAFAVAVLFLRSNGFVLKPRRKAGLHLMVGVADGSTSHPAISKFFRDNSRGIVVASLSDASDDLIAAASLIGSDVGP